MKYFHLGRTRIICFPPCVGKRRLKEGDREIKGKRSGEEDSRKEKECKEMQLGSNDKQRVGHCLGGKREKRTTKRRKAEKEREKEKRPR